MGSYERIRHRRELCALCCSKCEENVRVMCNEEHKGVRYASKTTFRCRVCKVALCTAKRKQYGGNSCFEVWHTCLALPSPHTFCNASGMECSLPQMLLAKATTPPHHGHRIQRRKMGTDTPIRYSARAKCGALATDNSSTTEL